MTKNSVEWRELMELIDFAHEICSFVVGSSAGCGLPRRYDNIDDIRSLFRGLRNGERYSARKMQESGYDCCNDAISEEIGHYIDGVNSRTKETPDVLEVPLFFEGSLADVLG